MNVSDINVLGITADNFALKEIRLRKPLESLKRQGFIKNYSVIDGFNHSLVERLSLSPDPVKYNVVILQRLDDALFTNFLYSNSIPFIFDIDDLIVVQPCYRKAPLKESSIKNALQSAQSVSVSTKSLMDSLSSYLNYDLQNKSDIIPNGIPLPLLAKSATHPTGIILVQSDSIALTESKGFIFSAVNDFCEKYQIPLYIISGKINDSLINAFKNVRYLGLQSFHEHLDFLHYSPTMIGIAPLETQCDKVTLDFINAKSDIKMVQYGGFGHSGVYSKTTPFSNTDIVTGKTVENSYDDWYNALVYLYNRDPRETEQEQTTIISQRHIDVVAREYWRKLVCNNIFSPGITISDLFRSFNQSHTKKICLHTVRYQTKKLAHYVYNFLR